MKASIAALLLLTALPSHALSQRACSPGTVRRYLTRAGRVPSATHHSLFTWTPCYAAGIVRFVDGRSASWYINLSRFGSLVFVGKPEMKLYCPGCNFRPFAAP